MSEESMERIVGRAVTNREYRERLLARPEEALEGYHLTDEEMCRVKGWTDRTFEMLIDDLERQVDGLRFDASAGFRELDDDRPRHAGERISPAALRFLLPRCLPELYGASSRESSRDDARFGARPIRPKPDPATLDAANRRNVCRHGIEWLDHAEALASALADVRAADERPDATREPASAGVLRHPSATSAFAQVLACDRDLQFDPERLNPNGGAIALGHPIGCTGVRITTTLLHEMKKRHARRGLATLCISGGMGIALLVERV